MLSACPPVVSRVLHPNLLVAFVAYVRFTVVHACAAVAAVNCPTQHVCRVDASPTATQHA